MKRILCIVIACAALFSLHAQKPGSAVKGKLIDTATGKPISSATVSVLHANDSSWVTYTVSNDMGSFEIKGLEAGSYNVIISHEAFNEIKKRIVITTTQKQVDLGQLSPPKNYKTLGEVIVKSETPIVIKNDTIQFNANSFKTRPNATVEDLLKKLPGVEVDREGNVKAQGEKIQKVYVDGKEFFGNDPKLATRNLTADMVESVQVFDEMSEQAKFTKIDDGSRNKTINIKLKKDKKKGYFSRAMASYGDNNHYEGNVGFNKFSGNQRISFLFNANNINHQGFSFSDISSSGRPDSRAARGGNGLSKSISTGLNFSDEWGRKIKINGSYFFSNTNTQNEVSSLRRSTFNDSTAVFERETGSDNKNQNHRFNLRFEYQIDSLTSVLYTPYLSVVRAGNNSQDSSFAISELPDVKYLSLTGMTRNNSKNTNFVLSNNLLFRHRFGKNGRTFTLAWNNSFTNSDNDGFSVYANRFYNRDGAEFRTLARDQKNQQNGNGNNHIVTATYTEPVGIGKLMELNYTYVHNYNVSDKKTFDFNSQSGEYDAADLLLTNNFKNTLLSHRFGANYRVQKKKYNYQLGVGVQRSIQESDNFEASRGKDSVSRIRYINFFPTANFNYQPSRNKTFRLNYSGRSNPPSPYQLQNVLDISDPLNVRTGNPLLKQEFSHGLGLGYHTFNTMNFRFFAANLGLTTTTNRIVNSIDTLVSGVQLSRPENVNGNYSLNSYVTFGFPSRNPKLKGSTLNFSTDMSYSRGVSLLYKQRNISSTAVITQNIGVVLTKEKFNIGLRANLGYTNVHYSINRTLDEDYLTQTYSADFYYIFKGNIILSTDFDYFVTAGRAEGFDQNIPFWNGSIAKQFLKKKNAEIRFSVNDILNQNQSFNRSTGENYIQDTRSKVLRRYFMVNLLYSLNKMGGH